MSQGKAHGAEEPQRGNPNHVFVIVTGKANNGKSTALSNIFDLDLDTACRVESGTSQFSINAARKKEMMLYIIDTPGFGALDIESKKIATATSQLKKLIGNDYVLLYCVSISPPGKLTEEDGRIIKLLHKYVGEGVWDKCVLLFTFCDNLRRDVYPKVEDYKGYVERNAKAFHELLRKCGSDASVRSIFLTEDKKKKRREIVGIPAGKSKYNEFDILPSVVGKNENWTLKVVEQIIEKTEDERRKESLKRYAAEVLIAGGILAGTTTGGAAAGIAIGAAVGSFALTPAGAPIGVPIGIGVGAAVGVAAGLISGAGGGMAIKGRQVYEKKKAADELLPLNLRDKKKLKEELENLHQKVRPEEHPP